jgi:non-specific serine/threonine protein kinase
VGHGGQTLLSAATQELVRDTLPPNAELRDLGVHRLKDLQRPEHIYQLAMSGLPADFPPLTTLEARLTNLPLQPTPFIGREREVTALVHRLRDPAVRLLTLTGPGGTGKTRLAVQVAAELLDAFPDGVFFVDLAPIRDPNLVATTIAQALGVKEVPGQPLVEGLQRYLQDRHLLLVLDNFEQVVEAAPLVAELLGNASRLTVLVTSRVVLCLRVEHELPVPPLAVPDPQQLPPFAALAWNEAVMLFSQRAQAVQPDFRVTPENAAVVAEICQHLDGLPLAIELAAARSKLLSPQALLARLAQRVPGRLKVLTAGARDLPARQQTLRSTIDWSYSLLDAGEQALFARLGVFVGGFTLEAAEAICNADGDLSMDVLDGLHALLNKSLLRQAESVTSEPRFVMLETIREYALERLTAIGAVSEVSQQHVAYFLTLATTAARELRGHQQVLWLARLEEEHDNLRSALAWSLTDASTIECGLQLAGNLVWFWWLHSYFSEGRRWLEQALAVNRTVGPGRAAALNGLGILAFGQGDYRMSAGFLIDGLALYQGLGDHGGIAWSRGCLGVVAGYQGDLERAAALLGESRALFRRLGERWERAWVLACLGEVVVAQGDYAQAEELLVESLERARSLGDLWLITISLRHLGHVAHARGDYVRAIELYEEGLALRRELGDKLGMAQSLNNLGLVALDQGDTRGAKTRFEESLMLFRELSNRTGVAELLNNLGQIAQHEGAYVEASILFDESLALEREQGNTRGIALCTLNLGHAALYQAQYSRAIQLYTESLAHYQELGDLRSIAEGLEGLAAVAAMQGQAPEAARRAARLCGAADALRDTIGAPKLPDDRLHRQPIEETARVYLDETDFAAAMDVGRAMPLEQAIAYALEETADV